MHASIYLPEYKHVFVPDKDSAVLNKKVFTMKQKDKVDDMFAGLLGGCFLVFYGVSWYFPHCFCAFLLSSITGVSESHTNRGFV